MKRFSDSGSQVGVTLVRGFIVGHGIDYPERYRQLPALYLLEGAA